MSNVLIGIIGVILFIGLALAGAMILGDDFKSSNTSSRASTYMARIQQLTSAGQMYQLKTNTKIGAERNSSGVAWLMPRFLKSVPSDSNYVGPNTYNYAAGTAVYMQLQDSKGSDVCTEIQHITGQIGPNDAALGPIDMSVAITRWPIGCVIHGGTPTPFGVF